MGARKMGWDVAGCLWAAWVLGCAGAASSAGEVSGAPDAGVPRAGPARPDAGFADEPPEPLPLSGCGERVPDCPGGAGTLPSEPTPRMPTDSPHGPGPDPSPID